MEHARDEVGIRPGPSSRHSESGTDAVASQFVENLLRVTTVRPAVEGKGDDRLSGLQPCDDACDRLHRKGVGVGDDSGGEVGVASGVGSMGAIGGGGVGFGVGNGVGRGNGTVDAIGVVAAVGADSVGDGVALPVGSVTVG